MQTILPTMNRFRNLLTGEQARAISNLSTTARLYIGAVCLGGLLILAQLPPSLPADAIGLVIFFVLGALAQLMPIRFYKEASVSLSMAVALAAILVYGPIFAAWVNLGSGIVHYLTVNRPRHRPVYRSALTTATLVIAAWVSGQLYLAAGGQVGAGGVSFGSVLPLALTSLCYYLLNTLLITTAMALEQNRSFLPLLKTNYQWLTVNVAALTPLGFGIAFIHQEIGWGGLALFLVPMVLAQYSFHLYSRGVENVRKTNDELKEANDRIRVTNDEMHRVNELVRQSNAELKDANERLNVMYEVSRSLVGSLHLPETLTVIADATKLLGFSAGFIASTSNSDPDRISHWRATHPAFAQWALDEPDRAAQTALRKLVVTIGKQEWFGRGEIRVLDAQAAGLDIAQYHYSSQEGNPLAMLTLMPLMIRSEPWGVVGFGSTQAPLPIEMKELLILRSMAENALEMALAHEQAERDALIDARTGLFNHRYFQEALQRELHDAAQRNSFLSFLMLDINSFKEFNDVYGHLVGDRVLEIVATLMRENVRDSDIVCRYGGDEMCVLLPQADRARAMEVAARIDRVIRSHPFHVKSENGFETTSEDLQLRVSIGVATFPEAAQTRAGLVEQADRACYRAKMLGGGVVAEIGQQETNETTVKSSLIR